LSFLDDSLHEVCELSERDLTVFVGVHCAHDLINYLTFCCGPFNLTVDESEVDTEVLDDSLNLLGVNEAILVGVVLIKGQFQVSFIVESFLVDGCIEELVPVKLVILVSVGHYENLLNFFFR
jgi:hypothetical protein